MNKSYHWKELTITVTDEDGKVLTGVTVFVPQYDGDDVAAALEELASKAREFGVS